VINLESPEFGCVSRPITSAGSAFSSWTTSDKPRIEPAVESAKIGSLENRIIARRSPKELGIKNLVFDYFRVMV
jgi:hypothetical protein